MPDDLLTFLKLLADETRLNIIGLLAQEPRSVDELAAILNVGAPTISHHLTRLHKAGLVAAKAQQYYSIYALNSEAIQHYTSRLTPEQLARRVQTRDAVDQAAYIRQILSRWVQQDRLQGLPTQIQHRRVVLTWLVEKFDHDKRYEQAQVWHLLDHYCLAPDATEITRALVDASLLARTPDGCWYWRPGSPGVRAVENFTPELLPRAEVILPEPWERWREGRLMVSNDPKRQRLNLMAIALRFKPGKAYTEVEVEAIIQKYSEGDPATIRAALLGEQFLQQHEDGTYWRIYLTP
jgi:biotin operon repressor